MKLYFGRGRNKSLYDETADAEVNLESSLKETVTVNCVSDQKLHQVTREGIEVAFERSCRYATHMRHVDEIKRSGQNRLALIRSNCFDD